MTSPSNTPVEPVYYHNCPILGPQTKVMRALVADNEGVYVLAYQRKCFCGYTAGEKEYAKGVTPAPDGGYFIDTKIAEKLHD